MTRWSGGALAAGVLALLACSESPGGRDGRAGGDGADPRRDGAAADARGEDAATQDAVAADGATGCPGDELAPFEGGAAYYGQFASFPSEPTFFPIAVWLQSPQNAAAYKAIGINTFVGLWEGPTDAQLDGLKAEGLRAICDQNSAGLARAAEPTIIAWMHGDEPDNAQANGQGGYDPCIDPQVIQQDYAAARAADPTRPVYLNLGRGVADTQWVGRGTCTGKTEMYPEYAKGADILSYDIYPVNDGEAKLWMVAEGVDNLRGWAGYSKPVWNWIETTAFGGGAAPTPAQVKAEVWLSLVHGSLGIGYFVHVFEPSFVEAGLLADAAMSQAVGEINAQITALAPALNTPSVKNGVTITSSDAQVPVHAVVKRQGGATYLFAVAARPGATTASFALTCVAPDATAEVLGEGRSVKLAGGVLEDAFSDFAVHLYRIGP